ncbi:patched domain-containing protein 3-like [Amphiura filiformis]|uniref:patched domain-containing protein 3-like n=1 Tax=Amphiura filiformis TaxID=82378 RepID=UPI003B215128
MAWYEIINHSLSSIFYSYGKLITRHKRKFLLCPLLLASLLSLGVICLTFENDAIYLFTPPTSRARADLIYMEKHFPVDYDDFIPSRALTTQEKTGNLYIMSADGGNVLRGEIISDILQLNAAFQAMEVTIDNNIDRFNFSTICARFNGQCLPEFIISFLSYLNENGNNFLISYPFTVFPNGEAIFLGYSLGGVTVADDGSVVSAQAIALNYILQSGTPEQDTKALQWEEAFTRLVESWNSSSRMAISHLTSQSLSDELLAMTESVMPLMIVTFCILTSFAVTSCIMTDWVQAKPWLGVCGLISAFLAISSTVGLLSACGVAFNQVVASMPFLVIGVGIDDMFIMVASWRHTDRRLAVEERMGLAYLDAAVSITITSVTDALAFCIGAITPLPAVRIFCLYAGVAIIFDYLFQITFFGACMVYTGQREADGKHYLTCKKVLPKDEAPSTSYRIWCAGGVSTTVTAEEGKQSEQIITQFFRKFYGPFIVNPVVKMLVVVLFTGYLCVAVWGCLHIQEGLQLKDIFADDSFARKYYQDQGEYFTEFGAAVSVVLDTNQNYWEKGIQNEIEHITMDFESSRFIHGEKQHTESWVRDYLTFLSETLNTTNVDQELFVQLLRDEFLTRPEFQNYNKDINFNCEKTEIESSRFVLKSTEVVQSTDEMEFMSEMRHKADSASLSLTIFSPTFIFIEQYVIIVPNTIQALLIATGCMFIVALFLMPHPVCAVMVTVCIVTIETGVIGVMSLWNVKLDGISMINIILCIGFSVDFSSHMTYAFITSPGKTGNERAMDALHTLGTPILQGGLSTILGISVLSSSPAYVFRAFFRTMFLVMLFGLFHSLVFLPVFLSFLNTILPRKTRPTPEVGEIQIEPSRQANNAYSPIPKDNVEDTQPLKNKGEQSSVCKEQVYILYNDKRISLDSVAIKETVL